MSIIKLIRAADSFTRIPNKTAQDQNLIAESLSVIVYLSSLPENWVIRELHVRKRFKWGRCRMRKVWDNLEKHGYVQRLHRQRLAKGRIGTKTNLAVFPHYLTDSIKPDIGDYDTALTEGGREGSLQRKNKQKPIEKGNKRKTSAKGVEKPSISINEAENIIGIKFTKAVSQLGNPNRIVSIIFKYKLEPEQIRVLFSQFQDYCSLNEVCDKWALFIHFTIRAQNNSLRLSSNAEMELAPWA